MTLAELMPHIAAGHIILVAEFRGGRVESSGFSDRVTGNAVKTLQLVYAVERQGVGMIEKIILRRYLLSGVTADQVEIKLTKGCVYAFPLEKFELKRGTIFGRMAPWEPVKIDKEKGPPCVPPPGGTQGAPNLVYIQTTPHHHEQK
jgi:hypothetical protein